MPGYGGPQIYADPNQVLAPLGRPDLLAGGFKITPQHDAGRVYARGLIYNIGTGPVVSPFKVVIGVSYRNGGQLNSIELILTISSGIPVGGGVETYFLSANLFYYDQDPTAVYDFEMIVDLNNDVSEIRSYNNRSKLEGMRFYSPQALKSDEPVLFERLAPQ